MDKKDTLEFESPINLEGSWGERNLAKSTKSTMDLYLGKDPAHGYIEWDIPALDMTEGIGLVFERKDDGKLELVDYDGVMTLPEQAMDLLERNGFCCADMRKSLAD